jgi:hypothetical protein
MLHYLAIGRDPVEHDHIAPIDVVESVREFVNEHPIVLEHCRFHARTRDIELLKEESPH